VLTLREEKEFKHKERCGLILVGGEATYRIRNHIEKKKNHVKSRSLNRAGGESQSDKDTSLLRENTQPLQDHQRKEKKRDQFS